MHAGGRVPVLAHDARRAHHAVHAGAAADQTATVKERIDLRAQTRRVALIRVRAQAQFSVLALAIARNMERTHTHGLHIGRVVLSHAADTAAPVHIYLQWILTPGANGGAWGTRVRALAAGCARRFGVGVSVCGALGAFHAMRLTGLGVRALGAGLAALAGILVRVLVSSSRIRRLEISDNGTVASLEVGLD